MKHKYNNLKYGKIQNKIGCIGLIIIIIAVIGLLLILANDGHLNWLKNLSH